MERWSQWIKLVDRNPLTACIGIFDGPMALVLLGWVLLFWR